MKRVEEMTGRELDAAVAIALMGYEWRGCVLKNGDAHYYVYPSRLPVLSGHKVFPPDAETPWAKGDDFAEVPAYSPDWNAAREVVEKVRGKWQLAQVPAGWFAGIETRARNFSGEAPTLPGAICRAALAWARRSK